MSIAVPVAVTAVAHNRGERGVGHEKQTRDQEAAKKVGGSKRQRAYTQTNTRHCREHADERSWRAGVAQLVREMQRIMARAHARPHTHASTHARTHTHTHTITFDDSIPLHLERHRQELVFNGKGLKEEGHAPELLPLPEEGLGLEELVRLRSQGPRARTRTPNDTERISESLEACRWCE